MLVVGEDAVDGVRVWDGVVEPLEPRKAAELGEGSAPAVLHLAEFDVFWRNCGGRRGPIRVAGRLVLSFHSSVSTVVAPSVGTVRGVQVEDRGFRVRAETGMRTWSLTDEPAGYRPVDVSPKQFRRRVAGDVTSWRDDTGVLVDVEITTGGRRLPVS